MTVQEEIGQDRGALSGVRILDMATVLAAPIGATLCADHGAEVVKLELPDGSDALRALAPVADGKALWWKVANRGKRGITLDVRKPEGRDILLKMLPHFDVLVENFRTGTMDRWGLDLATLHSVNPRLVVLRLTGFGQTGPHAKRPGYARVFEAVSGLTRMTGPAGGQPLHSNFPLGDTVAGLFAAFAIAAEIARLRGDPDLKGCEVDLAATEALFRLLDFLPVEHEINGQVRAPAGNRTTYAAPSNMYTSRDGVDFTVVGSSDVTFRRLCAVMNRPDWLENPDYDTNMKRVANIDTLDTAVAEWFSAQDAEPLAEQLEAAGVPFGRVNSIADIERDPQFIAREAIVRLADPDYGTLPAPCIVPRIPGRAAPLPRTGPSVGEHNAEVYGAFGYSEEDLEGLRNRGVI